MSEATTCEDLLRNFTRGRVGSECELAILFCQHLAWYPKTALPTTASPKPSHLLPPSFYPSPGLGLRPADPNLPALSLRTGPGQAGRGPGLPGHKKLGWGVAGWGWGVHLYPRQPLPPSVDRPAPSLWKSPAHTHNPLRAADLEQGGKTARPVMSRGGLR